MHYIAHLLLASLLVQGVRSFAAAALKPTGSLRAPMAATVETTRTGEGSEGKRSGETSIDVSNYSTAPPMGRALEVAGILGGEYSVVRLQHLLF